MRCKLIKSDLPNTINHWLHKTLPTEKDVFFQPMPLRTGLRCSVPIWVGNYTLPGRYITLHNGCAVMYIYAYYALFMQYRHITKSYTTGRSFWFFRCWEGLLSRPRAARSPVLVGLLGLHCNYTQNITLLHSWTVYTTHFMLYVVYFPPQQSIARKTYTRPFTAICCEYVVRGYTNCRLQL